MATLALYGDNTDRQRATKWFYSEASSKTASSTQSVFLSAITYHRPHQWREIFTPVIAHGFGGLKPLDAMSIGLYVNQLSGDELVDINRYDQPGELQNDLRRVFGVPETP